MNFYRIEKLGLLFITLCLANTGLADSPRLKQVTLKFALAGKMGPSINARVIRLIGASVGETDLTLAPSAVITLEVEATGGKWVGVSFKDSRGTIYDVPAHKSKFIGGYGKYEWEVPGSIAGGPLEVTIALWEGYDEANDKMLGELDRVPWTRICSVMGN